jgi:CubicO group peptidase (beta-lactamase class C family)
MDSGAYPSLTWRTPIASLIRDDFVLGPEYTWAQEHLTLEDALSHRTGFSGHDMGLPTSYAPGGRKGTVRDYTRALRYLPMKTEPRTEWQYCNRMFMVVSHVIQTLTQKWLGTVLKELIWAPLGMNSTYFSLPDALDAPEHLAGGYYWDYDSQHGAFHEVPFLSLDEASGAGGIASNVLDYTKWIRCLLDEAEPLSKEGHAAIKTPRMIEVGSEMGFDGPQTYSLGWNAATYKGHRVFMHSGGMEAYGAELFIFPELKYGIVTMSNTAVTSNFVARILLWKLINDKLRIPERERFDWVAS